MSQPLDLTKPETRPVRVVFYTDEDTSKWLETMSTDNEIELSLICHRIIRQTRDTATPSDGERRATERRRSA